MIFLFIKDYVKQLNNLNGSTMVATQATRQTDKYVPVFIGAITSDKNYFLRLMAVVNAYKCN